MARTWQDHSVPRAGCVRTKSLLITTNLWSTQPPLGTVLKLLDSSELPTETEAMRVELDEQFETQLSPVFNFNASELLEALFLEEPKPVVVFDVPNPELVALHLLAALWPSIRRRFSLSTFALSPRKIGGRNLDLVFSPSSAKARFSDWPGRRVDGRSSQVERHRWTKVIVHRVFEESTPQLLSDNTIRLLGKDDADNVSALRIALLWDELFEKLDKTPTAILGLLDIANSGMVSNSEAVKSLEPQLIEATRRVADNLSDKDALEFLSAITRKIKGRDMPTSKIAINNLTEQLAEKNPSGILNLLQQLDPDAATSDLISSISIGFSKGIWLTVKQVLLNAPMEIIAHLVSQGGGLVNQITSDDELIDKIGTMFSEIDQQLSFKVGKVLLPFLSEDRQLPAALPIISRLDSKEIIAKLRWLGELNDFQAEQISSLLIDRAREVGGLQDVRDLLIFLDASPRSNALLALTIEPVGADVLWLLHERSLSETISSVLLADVLRRADKRQFSELLSDRTIAESILSRLPNDATDILTRAALLDSLSINIYIRLIKSVLPKADKVLRLEIAEYAIRICLINQFEGDETDLILMLISIIGERLNVRRIAREGLHYSIDANTASRNLIAFENTPLVVRKRFVENIDEIISTLQERSALDLTETANDACAKLIFEMEKTSSRALVKAATSLMPLLYRNRSFPISLMIAALFPIVYRELSEADDIQSSSSFLFSFFDYDRCSTARKELVNAFMSSSWKAGDLALTAYRCCDAPKIFKQVARSHGGIEYLVRIKNDLNRLDADKRHFLAG